MLFPFIVLVHAYWGFFPYGEMCFFKLENVLSPEGRYVVYPVGVQLILFPFIVLVKVYWIFFPYGEMAFLKP